MDNNNNEIEANIILDGSDTGHKLGWIQLEGSLPKDFEFEGFACEADGV